MSIWLCIPSKRPPEEAEPVLSQWQERGYKIALFCDDAADGQAKTCDIFQAYEYPGYAVAVNRLVHLVMQDVDQEAEWFITGGDDVLPDPNHTAEEIARECVDHFRFGKGCPTSDDGTWGVMQPTGDRWGADEVWAQKRWPDAPAYIDRVCGSPWMGREFCRRANGGVGPLHPEFFHMHVDENLFEYAKHLGILWQRRDLIHHHQHWGRKPAATGGDIPDFLKRVNTPEHWKESKAILDRLKAEKWASCLPCV